MLDLAAAIGVLVILGAVMVIAKLCGERLTPEGSRKTIHIVMGCTALAFPFIFEHRQSVIYLGIAAVAALLFLRRNKFLREGIGTALLGVQRKSLGDVTGLTGLGFHRIELMPGHDSSEYHRHLYEEECVYVLSGEGTATIDGQAHALGPGDFLGFARGGPAHVVTNSGDEPLVLLVAGQRLEHDVCDYPHRGLRLYINGAQEDLVDVGAILGE